MALVLVNPVQSAEFRLLHSYDIRSVLQSIALIRLSCMSLPSGVQHKLNYNIHSESWINKPCKMGNLKSCISFGHILGRCYNRNIDKISVFIDSVSYFHILRAKQKRRFGGIRSYVYVLPERKPTMARIKGNVCIQENA